MNFCCEIGRTSKSTIIHWTFLKISQAFHIVQNAARMHHIHSLIQSFKLDSPDSITANERKPRTVADDSAGNTLIPLRHLRASPVCKHGVGRMLLRVVCLSHCLRTVFNLSVSRVYGSICEEMCMRQHVKLNEKLT